MKKLTILIVLLLVLAVPVSAASFDLAASAGTSEGMLAVVSNYNDVNYGKIIAISMGAGLLIGLIAVGIMASKMKTVHMDHDARNYVRTGSFRLTQSRDIFLYSRVHRTPKPKNDSRGGR